jgi:hypothetical protein
VDFSIGGNLILVDNRDHHRPHHGTIFMAAHFVAGPEARLPQMIQSRPQFGYVGALLVWLFAFLQYAGSNILTPSRR